MADELRPDGDGFALHLERDYDATPEEVWEAWTDPERLARWLAPASAPLLPSGAGASMRLTFGAGDEDWADVTPLAADPPWRLELRWAFPGVVDSVVRVEVRPLGEGRVRVVVDHRRLGDSTVGYGAGWEAYLARLAGEFGVPQAASWDDLFAAALPAWRERASAG